MNNRIKQPDSYFSRWMKFDQLVGDVSEMEIGDVVTFTSGRPPVVVVEVDVANGVAWVDDYKQSPSTRQSIRETWRW